ncbi:MAG: amino acid permease [Kiritimatiellae bacterium]|nr:amino acid permease [Kiritimatiellia bacterium]MDD5523388.1 amino acid permease [Kiritimatiellia bacterium]
MQKPKQQLSLFDSTCLIVGIIIGVGIYQMAPDIAKGAGSMRGVAGIWILGGLFSLCGALSYAELATAYPQEGGDYVYLGRAYGKWAGFLFGWAQLAIVRPGDIAVMAFAFATYASAVWDPLAGTVFPYGQQIYAISATIILTLVNVIGVREGKWTQNLLTTVKAVGLLLIVVTACLASPKIVKTETAGQLPFSLALIFVLFTYGGWNEMAYVAAEVRDSRRNIVRALFLGTSAVIVLYLMVNGAFLYVLGYQGLASSKAVAVDTVAAVIPHLAGVLIGALICISALGAVNGLIFAGARISYAMGTDHHLFRWLGQWHQRFETPAVALLLQGAITVTLIIVLGSFVNAVLYTAATVYSFYLASTMAVVVLRFKEPHVERPYRVFGYPVTPIIFVGTCAFLIYSAVIYKPWIALFSCGLLLLGLPLWMLSNRMRDHLLK